MSRRVEIGVTERARTLRSNATREERKVWELLSRYRPKFTRQFPIGPYVVDFACRRAKLVVEIDGGQHAESRRDLLRDQWLAEQGWSVFRVWNSDVRENPIGAVEVILARAAESLGGTHPEPLPSREGRTRRPIAS
ncbi:endonuclease domain-containing protein [Sphingomonas sp.]|uniref:endonuclease domain-containing protein n=1 Tax=Sphingomonas sp. TaxID=28214 RepID=UPI0038A5F697